MAWLVIVVSIHSSSWSSWLSGLNIAALVILLLRHAHTIHQRSLWYEQLEHRQSHRRTKLL